MRYLQGQEKDLAGLRVVNRIDFNKKLQIENSITLQC
jgi:hypothetical protein